MVALFPDLDWESRCHLGFYRLTVAFFVVWSMVASLEVALVIVSLRGSILQDQKRWLAEYLIYAKLGKMFMSPKTTTAFL